MTRSASNAAETPALEMDSIAMSFGPVRAVTDGNLSLQWGRVTALLGANGAGKSTMMNILGGVLLPTSGIVRIDGSARYFRTPRDAARAGIAFVQQELAVFPTMTVAENVFIGSYPCRVGRIDRTVMRAETERLLARLGARFSPDTVTETLSTGDRQTLTYFDGLEGKRPAARALLALWAEIQAGAQFIDMAAIGEAALEDDL